MTPAPQILLFGDSLYLAALEKALAPATRQTIARVNARTLDKVGGDLSRTLILTLNEELQTALAALGSRAHGAILVVDTRDHSLLLLSGKRLPANSLDELVTAVRTAQG